MAELEVVVRVVAAQPLPRVVVPAGAVLDQAMLDLAAAQLLGPLPRPGAPVAETVVLVERSPAEDLTEPR